MAANKPVFPASPHSPQSQPGRLQATTERELGKVITDVRKMRDGRLAGYFAQAAAPTGGTFAQGDLVRNSDPSLTLSGTDQYFVWGWVYASEGSGTLTWAPVRIWTNESGGGASMTATNIGASGQGLYSGNPSGELQFRKIKSGSTGNVTISTSGNEIVIDLVTAPFTAASMTATNAGSGSSLYINNNAGVLSFRTLKAGVNCSLSTSGSEVVVMGPSGLTTTRIPYATTGGSLVDTANFIWDNGNTRLGIGGAPSHRLHSQEAVNGESSINVYNTDAGAAAYAGFYARNNAGGTNQAAVVMTGTSYTAAGTLLGSTMGLFYSSSSMLVGAAGGDVLIAAGGIAPANLTARFYTNRNVAVGTSSLTVSSSVGFLHIPSVAGAPVAVPVAITGYVPMCYDRTNNNFYVYNAGWKKVLLA